MSIVLLTSRHAVEPYIELVARAADSERDSFGFLPESAYRELAYQGRMYVAVDTSNEDLAGYLLLGGAMPQAKIIQTYVSPKFRGKSVGERLIDKAINNLEAQHFLSVRADVYNHLESANKFYAKMSFDTISTRLARTKGRKINVRVRELATPSLLDSAVYSSENGTSIPVSFPSSFGSPLYLIDLNVLFDTGKRRSRSNETRRVFGAGFEHGITLAVTAELITELERNTPVGKPDPILEFALTLPRVPISPSARSLAKSEELAAIVFPDQQRDGCLSVQDLSDLLHLAAAIEEGAAGFITSENAILKASELLKSRYRLEVFSPEAFGQGFAIGAEASNDIATPVGRAGVTVIELSEANWNEAEAFLVASGLDGPRLKAALSSGTTSLPRRRHLACAGGSIVAFASWDAPKGAAGWRELYLFADERDTRAAPALEYLVQRASQDVGQSPPALLKMIPHGGQSTARRVAVACGFRAKSGSIARHATLEKISLGRSVLPASWQKFAERMRDRVGLGVQDAPPTYESLSQPISLKTSTGNVALALGDLETLLSPAIFALDARPGVILPILPGYAEELFRGSAQPSFLANSQAILLKDRGYIGGAGTYRTVPEGGLAIFYESGSEGGRKAATAVARITKRYLVEKAAASSFASERGVVERRQIQAMGRSKKVVVTEFDNVILFKKPVTLRELRDMGCTDGANFVTARAVGSNELQKILAVGLADV